eukprot:1346234-Pyramimonas_sp.AAC.1
MARRQVSLIYLRCLKDLAILGASVGGSVATWGRLGAVLGPLGQGILGVILRHVGLYRAILDIILGSLRPSWSPSWDINPSWTRETPRPGPGPLKPLPWTPGEGGKEGKREEETL